MTQQGIRFPRVETKTLILNPEIRLFQKRYQWNPILKLPNSDGSPLYFKVAISYNLIKDLNVVFTKYNELSFCRFLKTRTFSKFINLLLLFAFMLP